MRIKIYIFLLFWGCICNIGLAQNIPVDGILFGRPFQTNVDSELAKTMLTNPNDSSVVQLFSDYGTRVVNTETLSEIAQKYSVDVATLFFVQKIYEQEKNRQIQNYYLDVTDTLSTKHLEHSLSFLKDYFIVFVPGFRYKHAVNGSDFLHQRLLLDSTGISYEMIDIHETGLVEDNAIIIAHRLQELSELHSNIIVISVSKGGLETAIALGMFSNPEYISSVKAWINVCGILKGTPIADYWGRPLKRFWLSWGLFWARIKVNLNGLLTDLSYKQGKEKYQSLKIPSEINTINLIAAPLARQEKNTLFTSPNDGFSPLADAITEDGLVAIEMDLDHFFNGVDLNVRMVVLLRYIVNQLNQN